MNKRTVISFLLAAFTAVSALAQTRIDVQAPNIVEEGKTFNLVFIVEGEYAPSDFQWSAPEGMDVLWGPQKGTSTSMSIVNGRTNRSSKTTLTYVLQPTRTGTFHLGKATAKIKGNPISSKDFMVEVVSSGASSSSSSSGGHSDTQQGESASQSQPTRELFLSMSVSKKNVVVGEPVTVTLKLYRTMDIAGFEDVSFPTFSGFWSQEVAAPSNIEFRQEQVNGHVYDAALLRQWVLIPQKSGDLNIDPAELVCLVSQATRHAPTGTIFDQFNDTQYITVRKRLSTSAHTIHVSALPAGAPDSFYGGVGKYSIKASVSKDSLRTHDAASILVTVSGRGNVSLLDAPSFPLPPDFEAYDVKSSSDTDRTGTSGSRTFEYPFIPRSSGNFVLPPLEYSYFDPDAHRYVTVSTDSLKINVARTPGQEQETISNGGTLTKDRQDVKNLGEDIRFIRTRTSLDEPRPFFSGSRNYWIIAAILLVISAILFFIFRKVAGMRADVEGSRKRKATSMALRRLREAGDFLKKDLYTAFYESLHRSLLGFVSDKLSMDMASQTKENIEQAMIDRGVKADVASRFTALLDACEFARYAPNAGHDAMDSHYHEALEIITLIDSSMKKPASKPAASALAVILLLLPALQLSAQPADSLWNKGVEAYSQGDYESASASWKAIAENGMESVELYYNLGNAYFKDGNLARAILWWERARILDPSDGDVRHNLAFARAQTQDRIDSVPEFFLRTWLHNISYMLRSNVWAVISLVFFALALAMLLLFLLGSRSSARRAGFFSAIIAFLLSISCFGFASIQKREALNHDGAVVMLPVAGVKSGPQDNATSLFVLHEGTRVKIVDTISGYTKIELSDGRQGWIEARAIEII